MQKNDMHKGACGIVLVGRGASGGLVSPCLLKNLEPSRTDCMDFIAEKQVEQLCRWSPIPSALYCLSLLRIHWVLSTAWHASAAE